MIVLTCDMDNGNAVFEFSSGKFAGCRFSFNDPNVGDVFDECGVNISFEYVILNGFVIEAVDLAEFEEELKQHMRNLIDRIVRQNAAEFDSDS